jgi:hypothetical protein
MTTAALWWEAEGQASTFAAALASGDFRDAKLGISSGMATDALPEWASLGNRVALAAGMVAARVDCELADALRAIKKRAEATGRTLDDIPTP